MPDHYRELYLAQWDEEIGRCHECGYPIALCSDPDRDWYPTRRVCYASMTEASANRRYDALHEKRPYHDGSFSGWREHPDTGHPFHARDGVTITVSEYDLTPDEDFLVPAPRVTEEVDDGSTS